IALPLAVMKSTITVFALGAERLTVNVAIVELNEELPSATATSLMEIVGGGSLSVMLILAVPSLIRAFRGPDRFKVNDSSFSSIVSPIMGTGTILLVSP